MAIDVNDLNSQIQAFLKTEGHFDSKIDGKFGPLTRAGINNLLKEYKIPYEKWSTSRRQVAAEQLFYKSKKIDVGAIDGLEGPLMKNAREVWKAKLVIGWRDEAEKVAQVEPPVPVVNVKVEPAKKMNWPLQSGVAKFYGGVGTNQADAIMPYEMVLAWDTKTKIKKFSCHKLVKPSIERIFQRTLDYYGYEKIKELRLHYWGGCLNVRKIRGGSGWSMHSWGIAVDMDPDRNDLRTPWKKANFSKPEYKKYWEFVYDEGAISLGIERNYDAMHFQFARLG